MKNPKKKEKLQSMMKDIFGEKAVVAVAPAEESMSAHVKSRISSKNRVPVEEIKGTLERIAEGIDLLKKDSGDFNRGFGVLSVVLDTMYREFEDKHKGTGDKHDTFTKETEAKFSTLRKDLARAIASESKVHIDKAKSLEKELARVRKLYDLSSQNLSGISERRKRDMRDMMRQFRELKKELRQLASSDDNGSGIMILGNGTLKSPSAFSLNFKNSAGITVNVADNPNTGALDISFSAANGSSVAMEQLNGTQSGSNITLDLTQLSHTYASVVMISREGAIVAPGNNPGDGTSRWKQVGNIVTVYNADSSEVFLVQYTY